MAKVKQEKRPLPAGCSVCKSSPFVMGRDLFGHEVAERCGCARGRVLKAIDNARNSRQPQQQKLSGAAAAPQSPTPGGES